MQPASPPNPPPTDLTVAKASPLPAGSSVAAISFRRLIGTGIAAKLLVDIGQQIFNPFLAVFAPGMGIDVITLGRLVGLRSFMGIFAPLFGVWADRHGYRLVIRLALLASALGFLLLGFSTGFWLIAAAMIVVGLGTAAFVPTLQAYVSGQLPYSIRARGLGMIEYSWALTGIVGLSLVGVLIGLTNWRIPFFILAAAMVGMSFVIARLPATDHGHVGEDQAGQDQAGQDQAGQDAAGAGGQSGGLRTFFAVGGNARSTWATISAGALSYFAAMQVMLAHGAWLQAQYGLTPALLGLVAFVFGWFDLAASVAVSLFTDRIGKKRSVLLGLGGSFAGYLLMPLLNFAIVPAVAIIAVTRMCFEFNIVSHFPLLSEQSPAQRGKVMSLGAAVTLLGGTLAGFTGPWLLLTAGVAGLAWVSAAAVLLAVALVVAVVVEG